MRFTLRDRANLYEKAFPKFEPLYISKSGRIEGLWIMGNDYRVKSGYYGGYPAGYLDRILSMFPDCEDILHLFSGKVEKRSEDEVTFDINPDRKPDVCGNAEELSAVIKHHSDESNHVSLKFDLVLADPPYSESDAERYGTIMIKRNTVVKECFKVLRPGGFLVWLDQVFPMFRKEETPLIGSIYVREEFPEFKQVGEIGMIKSTNHRVRAVFIFQKGEK